jgi:hypothetical protein
MADQEEPALAVVLTKNGMTIMRPGMELLYERDANTQTLIETHSSIEPGCSSKVHTACTFLRPPSPGGRFFVIEVVIISLANAALPRP